ncbi:uncharacterized protein LOC106650596 isoform X1 [Trichogramma pretiosum]|uniref:uncharacterized protein LOC106650596 isoform X1 n=1 Tax=Trichogramma pretiosum TaxID=7493 RepID=UPI0006C9D1DB|nr:uncharacterized protein LOC106650596 isoform X1 [Trichogramma pretiosum]
MANMMRCSLRILLRKQAQPLGYRVRLTELYQRTCFHTSCLLDVAGKELNMPALSPTMENGTIVKWLKKEGDSISAGDVIADIQTDKAVMSLEVDDDAVLAKILAKEGTVAKVGDLIALTVEQGEDWKSVESPAGAGASSAGASTPAPSSSAPSSAPNAEPPAGQTNVKMPSLSPTMSSGTIVKWLKKEGDNIEPGDAVAEIQTDKAVVTFEIDEEVKLAKILAPEGAEAEVGDLIAIVTERDFDLSSLVVPTNLKGGDSSASASAPTPAATSAPSSTASRAVDQTPPSGQVYGLAVKRLLEEYGLSSGSVKGSGRPNRLLKEDVLAHIASNNLQKVPPKTVSSPTGGVSQSAAPSGPASKSSATWSGGPSTFVDGPVSNIRAVIAKRLGESKSQIPHSYASIEINIDKLNELRSKLRTEDIKVSVNDFITKAVAHALLECPEVNSLYQNGKLVPQNKVDISIAVSTPTGLITPIVFNAASKGLSDIANDIRTLAGKARDGKLQPQEFQGGTFTISNLGMFGIKDFSAIINPPQIGILAVGTGREVLDSSLQTKTMMTVTLSYDRRAIDDDQAADFLAVLQAMLQDPSFLAVGRAHSLRARHE